MSKIYVVGSAIVDIYAKMYNDPILKDSNPSAIHFSYGGVARNIAENLANFGLNVSFSGVFGNDAFAKDMYFYLQKKGVDLTYSKISSNHISPLYIALMNKDDLYIGASDLDILKLLSFEELEALKEVITDEDYVIFDTDFSEDKLSYICNEFKGIKIVDAISANKVTKIKKYVNKLSVLKVNKLEAEALLGESINNSDLAKAASRIKEMGASEVLISDSNEIFLASDKIYHYIHYAYRENPINVTGAGDALLSGYVFGKYSNFDLDRTIKFALGSAILTVDSIQAVADLNIEKVVNFTNQIKIEKK